MLRQTNRRRGFSLVAMLFVVLIVLVITVAAVTVAVPEFNSGHRASNELGAIKAIQTIHQAEVQHKSQFGRYACTLKEIGRQLAAPPRPPGADLIGNELSGGEISGYRFTLTCSASGYVITAEPVAFGTTGIRTFYSDQTMVIHQNFGAEQATANSPEMK